MAIVLTEIALVAAGGAIGCVGRYGIEQISWFDDKTYATITANIAGCLLIGIAWAIIHHFNAPQSVSRFLITGILGGFTTFSSFALHPLLMLREGLWCHAACYIVITLLGGLLACAAGIAITERILN